MSAVRLPQQGGCVCGAVRFWLTQAPLLAYACHCHDCQKATGSAFSLTLVIRAADFEIQGQQRTAVRASRAGRMIERAFCPNCDSPVFARAPIVPDYMSLRAGALDDSAWVRPISQSFVESALPWAVIPGVRVVEWADFDYVALGAEWTASAPEFVRA
jgi:hypothetical protein